MAKMGRPKKEISKAEFEKLCFFQCTEAEIASWFECSLDTICRWCKDTYGCTFADIYKMYSAGGIISLRRNLFRLSEKSGGVAIFLAKNYLGMKDEQSIEHSGAGIKIINDIPK